MQIRIRIYSWESGCLNTNLFIEMEATVSVNLHWALVLLCGFHSTHSTLRWEDVQGFVQELESEAHQPGASDLSTVMLVVTMRTQNEYKEDKCR